MGVPTATLAGETVVGRAGLCQAMNLGLPELIATAQEEFVRAASALSNDLEHLSGLRQTLRARLQQSPLMDGARFARNLESLYRDVWRRLHQGPVLARSAPATAPRALGAAGHGRRVSPS